MNRPLISLVFLFILFTLWPNSACIEPEEENPIEPDTTSHDFEWRIDTLGVFGYLNDISVIDENNIWVVGDIWEEKIGENGDTIDISYNLAYWNGNKWAYEKILKGGPLNRIWVFNKFDIWVSNGLPIRRIGYEWKLYHLQKMGIPELERVSVETSIWGSSSSKMYFGGYGGHLVHYNGSNFTLIETPTDDTIMDIWGVENSDTGESNIYAVVSTNLQNTDYKIFEIHNGSYVTEPFGSDINWDMTSIWFENNSTIYVGGGRGLWKKERDMDWKEVKRFGKYIHSVRGNHKNDIFIVGTLGLAAHYNGMSWKNIDELSDLTKIKKVSINGDIVAMVNIYNHVVIGKRKGKIK